MIKVLKFVQGAIAKEDNIPALTHFHIHNKIIRGFNGVLQLSSPIDIDITVCPNANQFIKAISTCEEAISLQLNDKGKLIVQSKKFKCFVDCVDQQNFPEIIPDGDIIKLDSSFIDAVKTIEPFIIDNVTRPWASGILLKDASIFATDNISIVESWVKSQFPFPINLPHMAVKELIRVNENPIYLKVNDRQATFKYKDDKILTTSLRADTWPDLSKIFNQTNNVQPPVKGFFESIDRLLPFINARHEVHFFGDRMTTSRNWDKEGTVIELPGLPQKGCYNLKSLRRLKNIAKKIDLSCYPKSCMFFGDNIRGVILSIHYHD